MPFAKINGTELYYEVLGQGSPLVLAHGGASNHISWFRQVVEFRDHHTVVTYDQRGFGFSEENGDFSVSAVDDLRELLNHLGYEKVALMGQSLGGAVVAGFASRYPERVRALVLSSTPAGLVDTGRRAPAADDPQPPYAELVKGMIGQDDFSTRSPEMHLLTTELIGVNSRVSAQRLNGTFYSRNDIAPIAAAGIPVLLINGDDDPRGTTGHMEKIAAQIPGSRLVIVPGGGHLVYMENPGPYNRHILDFLAGYGG
ncbi:MAG TPA: alpha/beta hydrolase [Trebonia sp.]|nr:alpha/beta hydrolase [Trebonia sp.]